MSTHVTGFKPPDSRWQQMKTIYDACTAAAIPIPDEVGDYFDGEPPDPAGVETELPAREWTSDTGEGIEIDVAAIPADVKTIRFWNAW